MQQALVLLRLLLLVAASSNLVQFGIHLCHSVLETVYYIIFVFLAVLGGGNEEVGDMSYALAFLLGLCVCMQGIKIVFLTHLRRIRTCTHAHTHTHLSSLTHTHPCLHTHALTQTHTHTNTLTQTILGRAAWTYLMCQAQHLLSPAQHPPLLPHPPQPHRSSRCASSSSSSHGKC